MADPRTFDPKDYAADPDNLPLCSDIRQAVGLGGVFSSKDELWYVSFGGFTRACGKTQVEAAKNFMKATK